MYIDIEAENEQDSMDLYLRWIMSKPFFDGDVDINKEFMGFVSIYKHLSHIIPKEFTVIDAGCAYAPQSEYFKDFAGYVGIDFVPTDTRFVTENSIHFQEDANKFLNSEYSKNIDKEKVFVIINYVPYSELLLDNFVGSGYRNIFRLYPSTNDSKTIMDNIRGKHDLPTDADSKE